MCEEIRIYVADLAAYNNGRLHGVWIDALEDLDDIEDQINEMFANSPEPNAEEYAIHDYEGFGGYCLSQYTDLGIVHEIACFIDDYPDIAGELLNHYCGHIDDAKKSAEDNYCGCHGSLADYAQTFTEETSQIPENLAYYIDYGRMGRDLEYGGDIFTIKTAHDEIHVFWSH